MKNLKIRISLITCLLGTINAANILGVLLFRTKSHYSMNQPLMRSLAVRGHNVTVISHFKTESALPNYTDVLFEKGLPSYVDSLDIKDVIKNPSSSDALNVSQHLEEISCKQFLRLDFVQKMLKSKTKSFDLIIAEMWYTRCFTLLSHFLDIPLIALMPATTAPIVDVTIGNPGNPSYIPLVTSLYVLNTNFYERLKNTAEYIYTYWGLHTFLNDYMATISKEFFNMDLPSDIILHRRVAAAFFNNHLSFISRPQVPNSIDIAGIHIREAKPLPGVIRSERGNLKLFQFRNNL